MQRQVLNQFLRAGPSRRFDVRHFTRRQAKEAPGSPALFTQPFLNDAILFKAVDPHRYRDLNDPKAICTLIYTPYDDKRPQDGGESLVFAEEAFLRLCAEKRGAAADPDGVESDLTKLTVIDSLPTLSPFIIELAFQRAALTIPAGYLQLTPEVRTKLTSHLKGRLRPLIIAAYKRSSTTLEKAVEELTAKLFCLRDLGDVLPLVEALRLPLDTATEMLGSWIGIAYFEHEYAMLQPKLKEFAGWLVKHAQCPDYGRQDGEYIASLVTSCRSKIRCDWNEVVTISTDYRSSYDALVFKGQIDPFLTFLNDAPRYYWRMGDVLGRMEQTVLAWAHYTHNQRDRRVPYTVLADMMALLRDLLLYAEPQPA